MSSVRTQILQKSLLYSSVVLLCLGLNQGYHFYQTEESRALEVLRLHNTATNHIITGHFTEVQHLVEGLANLSFVQNASKYDDATKVRLLNYLDTIQQANAKITHIYVGYANGELLINNYSPPAGFDVTNRPWYVQSMESDTVVTGLPYRDVLNNEWLITTGKSFESASGQRGVFAIDSALSVLKALLDRQAAKYKTSVSFIVDREGRVIIHPDPDKIDKPLPFDFVLASSTNSILEFDDIEGHKLAAYSTVDDLGWTLFTTVSSNEVFEPILGQLTKSIMLMSIIGAALLFLFSHTLANELSKSMLNLKAYVSRVLHGETTYDLGQFPNNEIGAIAKEVLQLTEQELYRKNKELEHLASKDQLTQLFNRRKIDQISNEEFYRFTRYGTTFSLIMFDIDYFKAINDVHGHGVGDEVLIDVASISQDQLRTTDKLGRWGGEEFLVICQETSLDEATSIAERLRRSIEQHLFSFDLKVTISLGVSTVKSGEDLKSFMHRLDSHLYEAKRAGRNRIISDH